MVFIHSFKNQSWLLPPSIEELIPEDHVCFLVENFMESLDYTTFEEKYAGAGHPAYHPRILLKLLVMGVLDKVRSSRRLARNAKENVVYMYLAEKLAPDFRTISDFRKNNHDLIKIVFKHTVSLAKEEGMLDLSHFSTDGIKIKANAANKHIFTEKELKFIINFINDELEEWAKQDEFEDDFFEELRGSDQLPKSSKKRVKRAVKDYIENLKENGELFKKNLIGTIEKAQHELEKNGLEKVSITDPESRFMLSKKGKIELSYNPQITSESNGFILSNDVCNSENDSNQLKPQVIQTEENLGEIPEEVKWSFDNSYFEGDNLNFISNKEIDGYIACQKKNREKPYDKSNFAYNESKDAYIYPEKKLLPFLREYYDKHRKKIIRRYKGMDCEKCIQQKSCTKTKDGIRIIKMYPYEKERKAMEEKMQTSEAKEIYKLRKQIVEPVFGDIKENKGITNFLTRGLNTVKTEFNLICSGNNIKRFHKKKQEAEQQVV